MKKWLRQIAVVVALAALALCGAGFVADAPQKPASGYRAFAKARCEACGTTKALDVHHKLPQHIIKIRLAAGKITAAEADRLINRDPDNVRTLCEHCHFAFGHLCDWHRWNANVDETIKSIKEGPQE